jgi:hypothetical protein
LNIFPNSLPIMIPLYFNMHCSGSPKSYELNNLNSTLLIVYTLHIPCYDTDTIKILGFSYIHIRSIVSSLWHVIPILEFPFRCIASMVFPYVIKTASFISSK